MYDGRPKSAAEPLCYVVRDFFREGVRWRMPRRWHNEDDEALALCGVLDSDGRGLAHAGHFKQDVLDFGRAKTLAGNLDSVVGTPEKKEMPVRFLNGEVTMNPKSGDGT